MNPKPKIVVPSANSIAKVLNRVRNGTQSVYDTCCSECDLALDYLARQHVIAKDQNGKVVMAE